MANGEWRVASGEWRSQEVRAGSVYPAWLSRRRACPGVAFAKTDLSRRSLCEDGWRQRITLAMIQPLLQAQRVRGRRAEVSRCPLTDPFAAAGSADGGGPRPVFAAAPPGNPSRPFRGDALGTDWGGDAPATVGSLGDMCTVLACLRSTVLRIRQGGVLRTLAKVSA